MGNDAIDVKNVNTGLSFEARANSIKQLCDLYRVVIALAVGISFSSIIDTGARPIPLKADHWKTFLVFVVTIIPFFHGAVRHLLATYVEGGGSSRIKNWAVLIDYYILFMEGGLFVALASTQGDTESFLVILIILLAVDSLWGLMATIGFAGSSSQKAEIKWAIINALTVLVFVLLSVMLPVLEHMGVKEAGVQTAILAIALARSLIDYGTSLRFYCP